MPGRLAETIFLALPAFRDAGATAYGLMLDRERYGADYRKALERILRRDSWSSSRMLEYQGRRLQEIIAIAFRHVPYYREMSRKLGLSPDDFTSARDLEKLPILEKEAVRADPARFVDERLDPSRLALETTSGTTGTSVRVFQTRRARQEHYAFFEARCRRVAGLRYGLDPHVTFGVKRVIPVERARPPFWCYNHAARQLYMSVFHLAEQNLGSYCDELRRRPYRAMVGYGSAMATIARYVLDRDIRDIPIPLAITSGETLPPCDRDAIERAFECRVFDQYGCTELAFFAAEGPCGRMHLSPDYGVLEIVDDAGLPAPAGCVGHVLGTSLINEAQILLRYRVGDMAALSPTACACGSPLPVIESVEGRSMNAIVLPHGHRLYRIGDVASQIPAVRQYQIVQEEIGAFTIYVVAATQLTEDQMRQLAANLETSVGRAKIRVEVVAHINRGPGGKSATVISKVAAPIIPKSDSQVDITILVQSGVVKRSFACTRRAKVADVMRAAAQGFGIAHDDRLLLVPAGSPGTALLPERTLESYGIGNGETLVLIAVAAAPARYRPGSYGNLTDDTPSDSPQINADEHR